MSAILAAMVGCGARILPVITDRVIADNDIAGDPADAFAGSEYSLRNDGVAAFNRVALSDGTYAGEWLPAGGVPADFEVRFTLNSGPVSGTFGVWLNLGTTRNVSVSVSRTTIGSNSNNGSVGVEIGRAGTGVALVSATITLQSTAVVDS